MLTNIFVLTKIFVMRYYEELINNFSDNKLRQLLIRWAIMFSAVPVVKFESYQLKQHINQAQV